MHLLSGYISINATNECIRDLDTDSLPEKKKMLFSYPIIYILLFVKEISCKENLAQRKKALLEYMNKVQLNSEIGFTKDALFIGVGYF